MRRLILYVLFIVLCSPSCTILKTEKSNRPPVMVVPLPQMPKTQSATLIPIDTNRATTKTVYITQVVPDKDYYHRVDSILNKRMSLYADSSRTFIGSQALVLADFKTLVVSNIKLIDSLKKVNHEKTSLKKENQQKAQTISTINNVDYYTASAAWGFMVIMIIFVLIRQSLIKREIIQELQATA